jgi:hypothetical protein
MNPLLEAALARAREGACLLPLGGRTIRGPAAAPKAQTALPPASTHAPHTASTTARRNLRRCRSRTRAYDVRLLRNGRNHMGARELPVGQHIPLGLPEPPKRRLSDGERGRFLTLCCPQRSYCERCGAFFRPTWCSFAGSDRSVLRPHLAWASARGVRSGGRGLPLWPRGLPATRPC